MKITVLRMLFFVVLAMLLFACTSLQQQEKKHEREEKTKANIANTNVRLGLGYLKQGRVEEALTRLKTALSAAPDNADVHSSIALVYGQLEESEKAESHFLRALEISPKDGLILNNYAVFLCQTGKQFEAETYFLRAINSRNYPTPESAFENLGVCSLQIPDPVKAEIYFRKALQINPRLPTSLLQMAHISVGKKQAMSGRAYLARYQEVAPLNAEGLWLGIQVEKELGDLERVRDYENRLYRYFPDSEELRLLKESKKRESGEAGSQNSQLRQKTEVDGR